MNTNIDERLQRALHDEAESIEPDQGPAWHAIQQRAGAGRGAGLARRRGMFTALAAAAVALVVLTAALVVGGDGGQRVEVGPTDTTAVEQATTTTEPPPSTTTTTAPPPLASAPGLFPAIWPFTSQAEVDAYTAELPADRTYLDAKATAQAFARSYLKMTGAVVVKEEPERWFTVVPKPGSPMRTRIHVIDVGGRGSGPYAVIEAQTANIVVTSPGSGDNVARPARVAGSSTAFEATIQVEVRDDDGKVLGETFTMGGSNGEMGPFSDSVVYGQPTTPGGAIVFTTESAEDGSLQEATVVRVGFGAPRPISVYFHRGDELVRVPRSTSSTGVLYAAMQELFAGPQPSVDGGGLSSPFSADTKQHLAGVTLRPDGTAVIDLARTIDNANSSEGGKRLLEELDATAFQFPTVKRIEYRLSGSCDAFWQWLQYGDCRLVNRP